VADSPGLFRSADKGILFLDEVGELPPEGQALLLRAIETRSVQGVGDTREAPVDVQIVLATNRNLEQAVARGRVGSTESLPGSVPGGRHDQLFGRDPYLSSEARCGSRALRAAEEQIESRGRPNKRGEADISSKITLTVTDVQRFLGKSKRAFYLLRRDSRQEFPAPFLIQGRDHWLMRDLLEWIESRRRRDAVPGRAALCRTNAPRLSPPPEP
jgi:predicted DNA-binding transcriptional regulator AlpA